MLPFQTRDRRCGKTTTTTVPEPTAYDLFIENFLNATTPVQVLVIIQALKNRSVINFFKKYIKLTLFKNYTKEQMLYVLRHPLFQQAFATADPGDTLVLTIGNTTYGDYSKNGGSRLILGFVDSVTLKTKNNYPQVTNPYSSNSYAPNNCYAKYANLDFTNNNISMSFDFDLSYMRPGVTACVYLVPMKFKINPADITSYYYYKEKGTVNDASYAKPYVEQTLLKSPLNNATNQAYMIDYADECGMGYNDAQGVGMGKSIEIDCIEATPCGLSVTLHGTSTSDETGYDREGVWCNVHNNKTIGSTLTKLQNLVTIPILGIDLSTYGPSSAYFINTLLPFSVDISSNWSYPETLSITTTISQTVTSYNQLVCTVTSAGFPNFDTQDQGLEHMNVIVSLWVSPPPAPPSYVFDHLVNTSWWLDGYRIDPSNTKTSVRGPCQERNYGPIPTVSYDTTTQDVSGTTMVLSDTYKYYDYAIAVASAGTTTNQLNNPSIFILKNMNVSTVENLDPSKNALPVYIQDFMYRGQQARFGENPVYHPEYFTGRYNSAYGVAYAPNHNPINTSHFIPAVTAAVDPAYWAYQTDLTHTIWGGGDYTFGGKLNMNDISLKEIVGFINTEQQADFATQHNCGSFFFDASAVILNQTRFKN